MDEQSQVQSPLPPTTTAQEDITKQWQRHVNIIWEITQSIISVSVTSSIIYCAVTSKTSTELTNAFFLIIGFYFSRTNHSAIGGVGPKVTSIYTGR